MTVRREEKWQFTILRVICLYLLVRKKNVFLVGLPIDPLIATVESSFKDTQLTVPAWPRHFLWGIPVETSQSITVLSTPQETTWLLSQVLLVSRTSSPCPRYVLSNAWKLFQFEKIHLLDSKAYIIGISRITTCSKYVPIKKSM